MRSEIGLMDIVRSNKERILIHFLAVEKYIFPVLTVLFSVRSSLRDCHNLMIDFERRKSREKKGNKKLKLRLPRYEGHKLATFSYNSLRCITGMYNGRLWDAFDFWGRGGEHTTWGGCNGTKEGYYVMIEDMKGDILVT